MSLRTGLIDMVPLNYRPSTISRRKCCSREIQDTTGASTLYARPAVERSFVYEPARSSLSRSGEADRQPSSRRAFSPETF